MAYITVTRYIPVHPVSRKPVSKKYPVSSKRLAKIGRRVFNTVGWNLMMKVPVVLDLEDLTVDLISAPRGSISGQDFEVTLIVASDDALRVFDSDSPKEQMDDMAEAIALALFLKVPRHLCYHVWVRALGLTGYCRMDPKDC